MHVPAITAGGADIAGKEEASRRLSREVRDPKESCVTSPYRNESEAESFRKEREEEEIRSLLDEEDAISPGRPRDARYGAVLLLRIFLICAVLMVAASALYTLCSVGK
jgi:hypothetical protein